MPEINAGFSPEEEIRQLERKLEEKKRELTASGADVSQEKQVFREVLRERVEDIARTAKPITDAASSPNPPVAQQTPPPQVTPKNTHDPEYHARVQELVNMALTKGLVDAVEAVRKINNPHLLDEFHDTLVDEYYDKVVAARGVPMR